MRNERGAKELGEEMLGGEDLAAATAATAVGTPARLFATVVLRERESEVERAAAQSPATFAGERDTCSATVHRDPREEDTTFRVSDAASHAVMKVTSPAIAQAGMMIFIEPSLRSYL